MSDWFIAVSAAAGALSVGFLLPGAPPGPERVPKGTGVASDGPTGVAEVEGLARFRFALSLVAGIGLGLFLSGWAGLLAGTAAAIAMWRFVGGLEPLALRRRREGLQRDLPQVVDLLGCCLAAGASTTTAVDTVAAVLDPPTRDELSAISRRLALGVAPSQVWSDVARDPQMGPLGRALVRAMDSGASVSDAMHRLAEDLRRVARSEVEGRARSVGAQAAAPLGLCLLPAFILIGVVPLVAGSLSGVLGS